MLQCWAWHAKERPTFAQIYMQLASAHPAACGTTTNHNTAARRESAGQAAPALVLNPLHAWQEGLLADGGDDEDETRI